MPKTRLAGKVIWITGASSGIGRALAIALAREGARLILSARRRDQLEAVRGECVGAEVMLLPFDIGDLDGLPTTVTEAIGCFGRIDIMVHNAGVAVRDRIVNTTRAIHEQVFRVNYLGPAHITRELLPSMLAGGGGQFVVISSSAGKFGTPLLGPYAGAKHALHGFFDSLRAEEHARGIVVTMIVPGFVQTEITANAFTGAGDRFGRVLPIYRHAMTAEECARRIVIAMVQQREEVLIGGAELWMIRLKRWFPNWHSMIIRNHPVQLRNRLLGWIPLIGRRFNAPDAPRKTP